MDRYKLHHPDHPERFSLDDLQLMRDPLERFQTLGRGGFGSIYLALLPKRTDRRLDPGFFTLRKAGLIDDVYQRLSLQKRYPGTQMEGHDEDAALMSALQHSRPVEFLDPAKTEMQSYVEVAGKTLTEYSTDQFGDLVNEALRLRNLWGFRNIVIVYGVTMSKELQYPCIVMERVNGCNLNTFLRESTMET